VDLPAPPQALLALADFVLGLLCGDCGDPAGERPAAGPVVVAPPAPFAANGYARARLLRQLHLSGALAEDPGDTLQRAG
jgi:hypothetical protein